MATKKKLLQAAAGSAGGAGPLGVEDVFSTYLYDGNSSTQTITNDIDLSGEGGLVWAKLRNGSDEHVLFDTERGATKQLDTTATTAQETQNGGVTAFNSDGFSVGANANINASSSTYVSWTFRKAPKFFDVVTYTGNGGTQTLSHNLDAVPGMIIVKRLDSTSNWSVYHNSVAGTPADKYLRLNSLERDASATGFWGTGPTSTQFSVGNSDVNTSGGSYVAYLFASNNGDGVFGPNEDQDIIKCGVYTSNAAYDGPEVTLGWEPQFLMVKNADHTGSYTHWNMMDSTRGAHVQGQRDHELRANTSDNDRLSFDVVAFNPDGFKITSQNEEVNSPAFQRYIYIAIRRGPMKQPTSGSDVFSASSNTTRNTKITTGFLPDLGITKATNVGGTNDHWYWHDRVRGNNPSLWSDDISSEQNYGGAIFDKYMDGWQQGVTNASDTPLDYAFKRAPGFFDIVTYVGNGTTNHQISHNLGVAPEMMWVKRRDASSGWAVYHSGMDATSPQDYFMYLQATNARIDQANVWNDTTPTDSLITLGSSSFVNYSSGNYIAYLFASLDGVSKVGSFSHANGEGDTNVDCGFSSGARFVLYKQYDSSGSWYVLDSTRGIVAGNDPALLLNSTAAEDSSYDMIDPYSSGFTIPSDGVGTGDYIFYAIA